MVRVTDEISFFTHDGDDLVPTPLACSMWSDDQLHGVARERRAGAGGRAVPGRDRAHRPAAGPVGGRPVQGGPDAAVHVRRPTVVREGSRICLVDVTLTPGRRPGGARVGDVPQAVRGRAGRGLAARRAAVAAAARGRAGERRAAGAVPAVVVALVAGLHRAPERRPQGARWNSAIPVVPDEPLTAVPGRRRGRRRRQHGDQLGHQRRRVHQHRHRADARARRRSASRSGCSRPTGSSTTASRPAPPPSSTGPGALGTVTVAALANARRTVDMGGVEYSDDGERRGDPRLS